MGWFRRFLHRTDDPPAQQAAAHTRASTAPIDADELRQRDAHTLTGAEFAAVLAADEAESLRYRRRSQPIQRGEYLTPEQEARHVAVDDRGLPNLRLVKARGQLVLTVPEGWVSFRSRTLHRHNVWTFRLRGVSHHDEAVAAATLTPGTKLRLVREPGNEHDPNAIAVFPAGGGQCLGYVNRQNAARIAKRLDAGDDLVAITLSGSSKGQAGEPVTVLITTIELLAHLRR
jgi:hypothetical protein